MRTYVSLLVTSINITFFKVDVYLPRELKLFVFECKFIFSFFILPVNQFIERQNNKTICIALRLLPTVDNFVTGFAYRYCFTP